MTENCGLMTENCGLMTENCELITENCELMTENCLREENRGVFGSKRMFGGRGFVFQGEI